jgi:hypothetical protein
MAIETAFPSLPAGGGAGRAMTVVANRSNVVGCLSTAAGRARSMLAAKAYVHWYERYDCSAEALLDAVECCTDIADSYRYFHRHAELDR